MPMIAAGTWWLHQLIAAHGLATTTWVILGPEVVLGIGIGALISPLFGFILAAVSDEEVGSASGVLNATQQLAGALGVAAMGTIFFATLSHHGYVVAIDRCLVVEMGAMPVLAVLTRLLPKQARDEEATAAPEDCGTILIERSA